MGAWDGTLLSSSRTVCLQSESVFAVEEAAEREAEASAEEEANLPAIQVVLEGSKALAEIGTNVPCGKLPEGATPISGPELEVGTQVTKCSHSIRFPSAEGCLHRCTHGSQN